MIAEQFKNRYFINGTSLFNEWGAIITKGGYAELLKEPQRKNGYSHIWGDQNGTQRKVENFFETQNISLEFVFVCETLQDYLQKSASLYNLLKSDYVTFSVTTLQKEWVLLYNNTSDVEELTDLYNGGLAIVKHTLSFFNDDVESGVFEPIALLTDAQGNFLTDEQGNFLTQQIL